MKKFFAVALMSLLAVAGFAATTVFRSPDYGFEVKTPVALTTTGPEAMTTTAGKNFTQIIYSGTLPNDDAYFVGVGTYPFQIAPDDLQRAIEGFANGAKGTADTPETLTVSGLPAMRTIVKVLAGNREIRFAYYVLYKGNRLYQFAFQTYADSKSNLDDAATFFKSITVN